MPIFEFECQDCGNRFEKLVLRAGSEEQDPVCPGCGNRSTRRVLSAVCTVRAGGSGAGTVCGTGRSTGFS